MRCLREQGLIPGSVYCRGFTPQNIAFDKKAFIKLWKGAGESSLVDLTVGKEPAFKVLIASVDKHPVTEDILHVDFHQVRMEEKITAEVEISFIGIAPAVKELGGVLVKSLSKIRVSCLPGDLISSLEVDLSPLKAFGNYIHVKDLRLPSAIKVLEKEDEVVVTVAAPRSDEELEALKEKPVEGVETVERVEKKEKKEGEEETAAAEGGQAQAKQPQGEEKKKPS